MALYKIVENDDDFIYLTARNCVRRRVRLKGCRFEKASLEKTVTAAWRVAVPSDIDIEEIMQTLRSRLS